MQRLDVALYRQKQLGLHSLCMHGRRQAGTQADRHGIVIGGGFCSMLCERERGRLTEQLRAAAPPARSEANLSQPQALPALTCCPDVLLCMMVVLSGDVSGQHTTWSGGIGGAQRCRCCC